MDGTWPMRLSIDGWRADGRTGVARYVTNIVGHWSSDRIADVFDDVVFCAPRPMPAVVSKLPANVRVRLLAPDLKMLAWQSLVLGPRAGTGVLWCPSYTAPLIAAARVVVTTHDATQALFPELYPRSVRLFYSRWYGWNARRATLVITNNEVTRRDIVRIYDVAPEKIRVVPLAPAEVFCRQSDPAALAGVRHRCVGGQQPFFLNVGTQSRRRNVPALIRGFGEFKRRTNLPHKLVLVGKSPDALDIADLARAAGADGQVLHHAFVGDDDLNALYGACDAFVLVPTYEANSLTAIEAQATGAPVIVADTPGMREMTGGHALFLPAVEANEIAQALHAVAADPALRGDLSRRSTAHARQFSWRRTAAETMAVLEEAARLPANAMAVRAGPNG